MKNVHSSMGKWTAVIGSQSPSLMILDESALGLLKLDGDMSGEELFQECLHRVSREDEHVVQSFFEKIRHGEFVETRFAWRRSDCDLLQLRCGGCCVSSASEFRIEGIVQDVTEMTSMRTSDESADRFCNVAQVLSRELDVVVDVNLEDGSFSKICVRTFAEHLEVQTTGRNFFKEVKETVRNCVYKDDVKMMLDFFRKESLLKEIKESACAVRTPRVVDGPKIVYMRIKAMKSIFDDSRIIITTENVDQEESTRINMKKMEMYRDNAIKVLSRNYTGLYLFNIQEHSGRIIVRTGLNHPSSVDSGFLPDMSEVLSNYISTQVHPDDRRMLEKAISYANVKRELAHKSNFSVVFRRCYRGDFKYTTMNVAKTEAVDEPPVNIAVGFVENDDEVRANLELQNRANRDKAVIAGLCSDFDCISYVNSQTEQEVFYRVGPVYEKYLPRWNEMANFRERMEYFIETLVHPDDRAEFRAATQMKKICSTLKKTGVLYVNYRMLLEGEIVYYQAKFVQVANAKGFFIVGMHSVDEEKRAEMDALEKAESANRAKTAFLFNMSHDIRTPINAIMGFTDIAARNIDQKDRALDCLKKAKQSSEHLLSLINEVLDMSRIESGKLEISEVPLDLMESLLSTIPMLTSLADEKEIKLSCQFNEVGDRFVYMDFLHMNQVIINLVSNAVKYTPRGGDVLFKVLQRSSAQPGFGEYEFIVEDNGIGIGEDYLPHVFEEFTRERSSTVSRQQGTGLGLAIAKRIIGKMGGDISVKSKVGQGTTFCVSVPLRLQDNPESLQQVEFSVPDVDESQFRGKKVLVVEDNQLNCEITVDMLKSSGFVVDVAHDGSEAVQQLRERGVGFYDCILMDVQMPVMDGYEATRRIRGMDEKKHVPIIALSANAFEDDRRKSLEAGMDDHQLKPMSRLQLLRSMSKLL